MLCGEKTEQLSRVNTNLNFDKDTRLWKKFLEFHEKNPHIYEKYKKEIIDVIESGHKLYSISIITEHNRWNKKYKINNNHRAYYARMFVEENPKYMNFFRFRSIRRD